MTDAPETIWARVKKTTRILGSSVEKSELREWCESYATPEIAQTCGAVEYTRSDIAQARIEELESDVEALIKLYVGSIASSEGTDHE